MITFTTEEVDCTPHQAGQTKTQATKRTPLTAKAKARITSEKARMHQKHSYTKSHKFTRRLSFVFLLRSRPPCNDRPANHLHLHSYPVHKLSDFTYSVVIAQWVRFARGIMYTVCVTRSATSGDIWIMRQHSTQFSFNVWQIFTFNISNASRERIP